MPAFNNWNWLTKFLFSFVSLPAEDSCVPCQPGLLKLCLHGQGQAGPLAEPCLGSSHPGLTGLCVVLPRACKEVRSHGWRSLGPTPSGPTRQGLPGSARSCGDQQVLTRPGSPLFSREAVCPHMSSVEMTVLLAELCDKGLHRCPSAGRWLDWGPAMLWNAAQPYRGR